MRRALQAKIIVDNSEIANAELAYAVGTYLESQGMKTALPNNLVGDDIIIEIIEKIPKV